MQAHLVREDYLDLVCLLDFDANSDRIDGGFHKDLFVCITRDLKGNKERFGRLSANEQ